MRTVNTHRVLVAMVIGFNSLLFNKLSIAEECPSFIAARTFKVESSPYSIATGDFNGDGKPDLVTGTYNSSNVSVLLSNGDGTFQTTVPYASGLNPVSVVVADFNADGKPDLAVANQGLYDAARGSYSNSSVSVLLGKGDGTFQTAIHYSARGMGCHSLAVADFNADGRPDLVVANQGSWPDYLDGGVSVLLNSDDGQFQAPSSYGAGIWAQSVVVGDFNLDGKPDLAAAHAGINDGGLAVFLGDGDGGFQTATNIIVADSYTFALSAATGDFNNDGKPDVIFGNGGRLSVLLGQANGSFQLGTNYSGTQFNPVSIVVGDFNGDAKADLAFANHGYASVSVLLGNGDGSFQRSVNYRAGQQPECSVVGDFNRDGKPDLAVANFASADVRLLLGNGNGTFQDLNYRLAETWSIAIADFDGDHKSDMAAVGGRIVLLLGAGDGGFGIATNYPVGSDPRAITVADFNSDGNSDIVVANSSPYAVSVFLGNGDATFRTPVNLDAGRTPEFVAAGDLNSDGKPDLIVANFDAKSVSLLLGNGDGSFQQAVRYGVGTSPVCVVTGDFNGDGKPDLAVANLDSSNVSVLLANGDGTFQAPLNVRVGPLPEFAAVGDFNRDGKLDLAVACFSSSGVFVLLGNGDGTFQPAARYSCGSGPMCIATGEFNGDGNIDLAVANFSDGTIAVLLNNGDGTFQSAVKFTAGTGPNSVSVGDFNHDGNADLAAASASGVAVFLNACDASGARLAVARSHSNVTISWPIPLTGFALESISSLSMTNWQPAIEALTTNNGRVEVTAPLNPPQRFFRLRKP